MTHQQIQELFTCRRVTDPYSFLRTLDKQEMSGFARFLKSKLDVIDHTCINEMVQSRVIPDQLNHIVLIAMEYYFFQAS